MESSTADYKAKLRNLGFTLDLSESTARRIWGKLVELDGKRFTQYSQREYYLLYDAFDAIATEVVVADTPDDLISSIIPKVVERFGIDHLWMNGPMAPRYENVLHPKVREWHGKKLQFGAVPVKPEIPVATSQPPTTATRKTRRPGTISSPIAARRAEAYMQKQGWTQVQFGKKAGGITDKTIRSFFETGKIRKGLLPDIAKAMKTDVDSLITDDGN